MVALAVKTTRSPPATAACLKALPFRQAAPLRGPMHKLLRMQQ